MYQAYCLTAHWLSVFRQLLRQEPDDDDDDDDDDNDDNDDDDDDDDAYYKNDLKYRIKILLQFRINYDRPLFCLEGVRA